MSDLTAFEKIKLESMFNMKTGYVLNFSDRTFQEFFINSVGLDLFDSKYETKGTSKANRMRTFWEKEDDFTVGKLLKDILYCIDELGRIDNTQKEELTKISERLLQTSPVPDLDALQPNTEEKDFEIIAKAAREAIEGNNPEQGLDRLHTFIIKFFRELCNKHGITVEKRKPLHSLVGEYLKVP